MKSSVEEINNVQRRLKIDVPAEQVDAEFNKQYRKIQKDAAIRGFRKGKAPLDMIKKLYGAAVASEVYQGLIRESLFSAIESNQLRPVSQPVIETGDLPAQGKDYNYTALVDILPALELKDYRKIPVTVDALELDDDYVEKELKQLQKRKGDLKPVEPGTSAAEGSVVHIDQIATLNGEELPQFKAQDVAIEIGQGSLFPEIEKKLVGATVGSHHELDIAMTDDFPDPKLKSQTIHFHIDVKQVSDLVLPELDDELAKDLGLSSLNEVRDVIRQRTNDELGRMKRQQMETQILSFIAKKHPFDVPPSMVDQVIDGSIREMQWPTQEDMQKALQDQELRKNLLESSKNKARNTLILLEIANQEEIKVADHEIDDHIKGLLGANGQEAQPAQVETIKRQMSDRLSETLLFEKTMNFLINEAVVSEIKKPME